MQKFILKGILTLVLSTFSSNAWADSATCPEGEILGTVTKTCVSASGNCGNGCTYTLDSDGTLTYATASNISSLNGQNVAAIPADVRTNAKDLSFDVSKPLTYMNGSVVTLDNYPNLHSDFILPNDIFAKGAWMEISSVFPKPYYDDPLPQHHLPSPFVVPENLSYTRAWNQAISANSEFIVYCTGKQIESGGCNSNATRYEHDGDQFIVYNSDGSIFGIYENLKNMTQDNTIDSYQKNDNGRITTYDGHGHFLNSYQNNADGSTTLYDANGKIIGFQGKRIYTVEEATLIVKPQGNTFKVRYR